MVVPETMLYRILSLHPQVCVLLFLTLSPCSAQAPGDEDERCTDAEDAPTYPDTVRNLMDSYNYVQLLPGSGTGNPPIEGAVWTDRSVDDNNTIGTTSPTYVSLQFHVCHVIAIIGLCSYSSGSMEVEEYVDFRYEFVDGMYVEARTTGSSLNTSVKALTPTLTITQWKYK